MSTSRTPSASGFTLIELLVTIAIMGILMAVAGVGVSKAVTTANRNAAAAECTSIAMAIESFYRDYGWMPVPSGDQGGGENDPDLTVDDAGSRAIIQILTADDSNANLDVVNPRKRVFLDIEAVIENGELLDPWGNQYLMILDTNYNKRITFRGQDFTSRAIVWSRGKDGPDANTDEDDVANVVVPDA
jgi:prepilin-type N-terminal cleavage/methylation domain-containing protein